jgi:nitrate reductase NapE component
MRLDGVRGFLTLVFLIGAVWAIDNFAYKGHYGRVVWMEAKFHGEKASNEVRHWLKKVGL